MKRKVLYALLSALIAFGLWIYVVTVVSPESEETFYNVPVVLNNESVLREKGLMIVSEGEPKLTLKLSGNRSDLNKLKSSDITVIADLAKINAAGEQTLNYSISFPGNNTVTVLEQSPQYITLNIVEWSTKDVPVVLQCTGEVPTDYVDYREEAVLEYEKITISGPTDVLNKITQAIVKVDLTGKEETVIETQRPTLSDAEGNGVDSSQVKSSVSEVQIAVKIHYTKVIDLLLDVTYGGGADENTTVINMDVEQIKIAGSRKQLEGIESLTIGSIDVAELTEDTELVFAVSLPEGVDNLSVVSEVHVSVTFPTLAVKTLYLSGIEVFNIPAGMKADVANRVCEVILRGNEEQISAITEENIRIRVDLSGAAEGEGLYKPQIIVSGYDTIGVISASNISVRLSKDAGNR